ncbi:MAG: dipicolinate synthase subunit DpsA [Bacillota bacterium]
MNLHDRIVVLIGGDRRELVLYQSWRSEGIAVKLAGFEQCPIVEHKDLLAESDLQRAAALIAPLSGIKAGGAVSALYSREPLFAGIYIKQSLPETLLLAGSVAPDVRAELGGRALVLTASDPELTVLNAVPTAEGAIQKAMEFSELTLHGNRSLVIGLGRCGTVLARALQGLSAKVTVLVRRRESAALAETMGLEPVFPENLHKAVREANFIFNTAPAAVLNATVLAAVQPHSVILDLAAAPGGTDFKAAEALGIKAVLLPGLPGKSAPRSAGMILERVYRRILTEKLPI